MPQQFTGTVTEIRKETPTVCSVVLALDTPITFAAGQYVLVTAGGEMKPYSISSPPSAHKTIELCVKKIEGGHFSNLLCRMKKGETLQLAGPMGRFVVQETKNDVVFLASGTGVSALRGMVHTLAEKRGAHRIFLFLGVRTEEEIIYRKEFEELEKRNKNFSFVPVLSRAGKEWAGKKGYVQDVVMTFVKRPGQTDIYICGVKAMVEECIGFAEKEKFANVFYEKYV